MKKTHAVPSGTYLEIRSQQQGGLGYTGCTLEADHPANRDN